MPVSYTHLDVYKRQLIEYTDIRVEEISETVQGVIKELSLLEIDKKKHKKVGK